MSYTQQTLKYLVILASLLNWSMASAESSRLKETLIEIAEEELNSIAQESGYSLIPDSVERSFPESNLLIPISGTATLLYPVAGAVAGAVTGVWVSLFWVPPVGANLYVALGIAEMVGLVGAGIGAITGIVPSIYTFFKVDDLGDFANYILYVGHYRTELHYSLTSSESKDEIIEGSCHLFYINYNDILFYEIDNCSHDSIFPQEKQGILRIGSGEDFTDEFFGQTNVVATGRKSILFD